MAINVGTMQAFPGDISPATATIDAGQDRIFIAFLGQVRNPLNLSNVTLDGVAPSGFAVNAVGTAGGSSTSNRVIVAYWLDADMPVAGTASLAWSGTAAATRVRTLNASGVSQAAPEATDLQEANSGSARSTVFAPYSAGSLAVVAGVGNTSATTVTSGTSIGTISTNFWAAYRTDGDTISAIVDNNAPTLWGGGSFAAAASGPSISVPDIKGPNGAPIGDVNPVTVAIWDDPEANPDNMAPDALITDAAIVDSVLDLNHETIAQNVRVRCRYVHEGSIRLFEVVTPVIQP